MAKTSAAPPKARGANSAPLATLLVAIVAFAVVASCTPTPIGQSEDSPYPPGVDLSKEAVDGIEVGHRLMHAGEFELAMDAFTRAALEHGMTPEIMIAMGTANLGLGRLGQAEDMLRRAVAAAPDSPEAWNNLGVVLVERNKTAEAEQVFRKAYALDNGESDSIRDNLRLTLAKTENPANTTGQNEEYKLVRQGSSEFLITETP